MSEHEHKVHGGRGSRYKDTGEFNLRRFDTNISAIDAAILNDSLLTLEAKMKRLKIGTNAYNKILEQYQNLKYSLTE